MDGNSGTDTNESRLSMRDYLLAVGVMTGNSLDATDTVLTHIGQDGSIVDLAVHSEPNPDALRSELRRLREIVSKHQGKMTDVVAELDALSGASFDDIQTTYIELVASVVLELIEKARKDPAIAGRYDLDAIDLIGFHGQTCGHFPPSIAGSKSPDSIYTIQIGDGQRLADLTGISVVYDFRSDDLMHGGEGAPLAPMHHMHLARTLKERRAFPVAFCNAGNTGNISLVSEDSITGELSVIGWDTGPFNHFIDALVRTEKGIECDTDGTLAAAGTVRTDLLRLLFNQAVQTSAGDNFPGIAPPKSSDPDWYHILPELAGKTAVAGAEIPFADRLRTASYFSAYIYMYSLTLLPATIDLPRVFALSGGGWKNPICEKHFRDLLAGSVEESPVLAEHQQAFEVVRSRLPAYTIVPSQELGIDNTAMEARIFADAAVCRIQGIPFTSPAITGAAEPVVCGIIRFPGNSEVNATDCLRDWLAHYSSAGTSLDDPAAFDSRWNRASAGWAGKVTTL